MEILQNTIASDYFRQQSNSYVNGETISQDFKRIIWFPEDLNVKNEKHLKFLDSLKHNPDLYAGADLIRSNLEELKEIIIQKISGHTSKANAVPLEERQYNNNEIIEQMEVTRTSIPASIPFHTAEQLGRIIQENNFSK
jgi:hypothetical protein